MNKSIQLTQQQQSVLQIILAGENVFLTGAAGSGKSFVIKQLMQLRSAKEFPILASTGAAAVLVGGRTFHSFFGLGIMEGGMQATIERALNNKKVVRRIQKIEGFILDEVSMISGETLRAAEIIARLARSNDQAWGGLQIVAVGDFAQLPPVQSTGYSREKSWAFLDPSWKKSEFIPFALNKNMRTQHSHFIDILGDIRQGLVSDRVVEFLDEHRKSPPAEVEITRLFPRRNQTDLYNMKCLEELPGDTLIFPTILTGDSRFHKQLQKYLPIGDQVTLKVGCFVMLRQNDPRGRWVNGSTGVLIEAKEDFLVVELVDGNRVVKVERASFTMIDADGNEVACATNYPINLAYAATIHKAQGMTLDRVVVNIKSLWEPGQAYVALSRVRDPNQLYILEWSKSSIKSDPIVGQFYGVIDRYMKQAQEEGHIPQAPTLEASPAEI